MYQLLFLYNLFFNFHINSNYKKYFNNSNSFRKNYKLKNKRIIINKYLQRFYNFKNSINIPNYMYFIISMIITIFVVLIFFFNKKNKSIPSSFFLLDERNEFKENSHKLSDIQGFSFTFYDIIHEEVFKKLSQVIINHNKPNNRKSLSKDIDLLEINILEVINDKNFYNTLKFLLKKTYIHEIQLVFKLRPSLGINDDFVKTINLLQIKNFLESFNKIIKKYMAYKYSNKDIKTFIKLTINNNEDVELNKLIKMLQTI